MVRLDYGAPCASATASARVDAPSLRKTARSWLRTVFTDVAHAKAISPLV
jgi:hypothetical protein